MNTGNPVKSNIKLLRANSYSLFECLQVRLREKLANTHNGQYGSYQHQKYASVELGLDRRLGRRLGYALYKGVKR